MLIEVKFPRKMIRAHETVSLVTTIENSEGDGSLIPSTLLRAVPASLRVKSVVKFMIAAVRLGAWTNDAIPFSYFDADETARLDPHTIDRSSRLSVNLTNISDMDRAAQVSLFVRAWDPLEEARALAGLSQ